MIFLTSNNNNVMKVEIRKYNLKALFKNFFVETLKFSMFFSDFILNNFEQIYLKTEGVASTNFNYQLSSIW